MSSIRQHKIESAIREELSKYLLRHSSEFSLGSMVTLTVVRISPDLSLAKCLCQYFWKNRKNKGS